MLGRVGRLLLAAFVTEVGGALIQAGRGWIDRKLNPSPTALPEGSADGSPDVEAKGQ